MVYFPTQFEKDREKYARPSSSKADLYACHLSQAFNTAKSAHDAQALFDMMRRRFETLRNDEQARRAA